VLRRPDDPYQRYALALALGAQGRFAEALRALDEAARLSPRELLGEVAYVQAVLAPGTGDEAATWRFAARAIASGGSTRTEDLAILLEVLGDTTDAGRLAAKLPPGSMLAGEHAALVAARSGAGAEALAQLTTLEARDPAPVGGLPPAFLVAWVAERSGDHAAALAAVERLERIPMQSYAYAWYWPQALLIAARAEVATGQPEAARDRLDRLLRLWSGADPGLPVLVAARRLRRSL
jgi:tetratricopeptide (TPR) repeat protein